jgi:hypothetical protein
MKLTSVKHQPETHKMNIYHHENLKTYKENAARTEMYLNFKIN